MKKFILLAALGIAAATYQPASAQVSINVNIGIPAHYGYNNYYAPNRPVVYLDRSVRYNNNYYPKRNIAVYRTQPVVQHRSYFANHKNTNKAYSVKQVKYKNYNNKFNKDSHGRGHGKGKH